MPAADAAEWGTLLSSGTRQFWMSQRTLQRVKSPGAAELFRGRARHMTTATLVVSGRHPSWR